MVPVSIVIPCLNEAGTIGSVVRGCAKVLPDAVIYVCDNGSQDDTIGRAREAGAIVLSEPRRGKGYAMQTLLANADAAIYLMIDGDGTYPVELAPTLVALVSGGRADMAVGSRLLDKTSRFRPGNRMGNRLFAALINLCFGAQLTDVFTGYRAMSREFVRSMPLFKRGFEVETELTIRALDRGFRIAEVPCGLADRAPASHSKLKRLQDGAKILWTVLTMFRDYKPLTVFGGLGLGFAVVAVALVWMDPAGLGTTEARWLAATLSAVIVGAVSTAVGLVLHCQASRIREVDAVVRSLGRELDSQQRSRSQFSEKEVA